MFIDRQEINSLYARQYNIQCLLDDDIRPETKNELREEVLLIEDDIRIIEANYKVAR